MSEKVQWPGKAYGQEVDDLGSPTRELVDRLDLVKTPVPDERNSTAGIIGSTSLEVTNQVKRLITAAGGGAAVIGAAGSVWAAVKEDTALAVVLAGGVAFVLGAAVLALALVMNGDVRGRAAVTVAQMHARADVAVSFVEAAEASARRSASADSTPKQVGALRPTDIGLLTALALGKVKVTTTHGESGVVQHADWADDGLRLTLDSGDHVGRDEVRSFASAP